MKRLIVPGVVLFALAGCGGGGGSTSGGGAGGVNPPAQPSAVRSVPTQRAVAGQTLQTASAVQSLYLFAGGGTVPLSTVRKAIDASARRVTLGYATRGSAPVAVRRRTASAPVWSACSNASESATVVVSATEEILYLRSFYDAACTNLKQDVMLDVVATSSTAGSISGTLSSYTTTGTQYAYQTLALSFTTTATGTLSTISLQTTDAVTPTSPQLDTLGVACGVSGASATCGAGAVEHSQTLNADAGMTLSFAFSASAGTNGLVTVPVSLNSSAYSGALNALQLAAATFPNWSISGGTLLDTASVSGQLAFTASGVLTSGTLALTDTADHASVTMTTSTTGTTGSVTDTATNTVVATFTVDPNGNGTIHYGDGTVGQITGWQIVS